MGRLKEEGEILPISSLPTLMSYSALGEDVSRMEDGTIMVQGDHSMALENQRILPHRKEYSPFCREWWPLMHALARLRRFWISDSFLWKTSLQKLQPSLEHEQLQKGQQEHVISSIPVLEFGIGDVKEEGNHMKRATQYRSAMLSLEGLDPYWRS